MHLFSKPFLGFLFFCLLSVASAETIENSRFPDSIVNPSEIAARAEQIKQNAIAQKEMRKQARQVSKEHSLKQVDAASRQSAIQSASDVFEANKHGKNKVKATKTHTQ